jgi:glycosyltransferase involved in cell wall biosynthesis
MTAKVFIGMPVYNGERFVAHAIKCFISQTHPNWVLLISDNCSSDNTFEICKEFSQQDKRISVVRQDKNIGAPNNFKFVLSQANTDFFMWAAFDDHWEPHFLEKCLNAFRNHNVGMTFSNTFTISNPAEQKYSAYDFSNFSGKITPKKLACFLITHERNGQANTIYSLYRTPVVKYIFEKFPLNDHLLSDVVFTLATISRKGIYINPEYLFGKRYPSKPTTNNNIKTKFWNKTKFFLEYFVFLFKCSQVLYQTPFFVMGVIIIYFKALRHIFSVFIPLKRHEGGVLWPKISTE